VNGHEAVDSSSGTLIGAAGEGRLKPQEATRWSSKESFWSERSWGHTGESEIPVGALSISRSEDTNGDAEEQTAVFESGGTRRASEQARQSFERQLPYSLPPTLQSRKHQ
jgi:hypothetical protein